MPWWLSGEQLASGIHPPLPPPRPNVPLQVIVPTIGSGSGAGLSDWRGWLGFGLSLASMAATVVYFVSLQASRRLGFTSFQLQAGGAGGVAWRVGEEARLLAQCAVRRTSVHAQTRRRNPCGNGWLPPLALPSPLFACLQYLYLLLSVAVLLPISLGVEGTDWPSNFRGWTGGDWAVLCVMSCCVVIGANLCIQHR